MWPRNDLTARMIRSANMPEDHREIWEYFLENQMRYPRNVFIPPFKRPSKPDKPRILSVAEFSVVEGKKVGFPTVLALRYQDRWDKCEVQLFGDSGDARRIADLLFRFRRRGWFTVFRQGNARDFRIIAQRYIRGFLALGFSVQPINAGSELIALKIRKGGHVWQLLDFEKVTGVNPDLINGMCPSMNGAHCACTQCLDKVLDALYTIQNYLVAKLGVSLRVTIGSAAIRAAAFHLPNALWKWKPHPLLVTMCRLGGAFRGGHITGRGYRGNAWMVDTNRMYTWALTRQLPLHSVLSKACNDGVLREGIYVVSIFGPASSPIYVPVWRDRISGFSLEYWRGDYVCSVLAASEIPGIESLGYRVQPEYGFRYVQTFSLATYVETLTKGVIENDAASLISRVTKPLGNATYGKFAERPERTDSVFSIDRPGPNYFPFVDINGDEISDLWERQYVRYNSHQHVDIAATITGYGRSHMYETISIINAKGGIIAATNTDSIITNIDPSTVLSLDSHTIGKWRQVAYDPDGITVARNAWAVGEHIALSGAPKSDRHSIELLSRGESLAIHGIRKAPLLPEGPISEAYSFTSAATASTGDRG